jgi:flagellar M-ring protein FliF
MQQIRKLVASLSARQRWTILIAALLVAAGVSGFSYWRKETGFRPLYTNLAPEDAGAVVEKLKQAAVEYRLEDNGTAVLVPEARISELRLQMAMSGIPKSGRIGFELFDKTNFGVTDFAEHINYRRALEGELERSLSHLAEVQQARVHLTFPKDSVFLEARQPAKASVMLQLRPGARLSPQNVQAICHLAASAVDGLAPEAVSVLDTRGNLLNRPRRAGQGDELAASEAALDYRRQIERDLTLKIRATLEPLLGAERFQTSVSVDCDLTSGEQSEESFDPARSVMLTSQKTEDSTAGTSTAGVPGTASNLPRPPAAATASRAGMSRRTENITYQSSRVTRRTRQPQGAVKRVSVALLVDQDVRWEGRAPNLQRVLVPPPPEKLKSIRDLVAGAISFDQNRGDQLVVESLPFDATLRMPPPPSPEVPGAPAPRRKWSPVADPKLLMLGGVAAGVLVLMLAGVWLMAWKRRKKRKAAAAPEMAPALPSAGAGPAIPASPEQRAASEAAARQQLEAEALQAIKSPTPSTKKAEVLTKALRESVGKDSAVPAMVLRSWLKK